MSEVAPDAAVAAAIAGAEDSLRWLKEMGEAGMRKIRALDDLPADESAGKDAVNAFVKFTRVVRVAIVLKSKTHQELIDLRAGVVRARDLKDVFANLTRRNPAIDLSQGMQEQVDQAEELVMGVIDLDTQDLEEREDLYAALQERLEEDEGYEGAGLEPMRAVVERLCKDLELSPDWSRWNGDGWEPDYLPPQPIRPRESPFNRPSRKPLLRGDTPPPGGWPKLARYGPRPEPRRSG